MIQAVFTNRLRNSSKMASDSSAARGGVIGWWPSYVQGLAIACNQLRNSSRTARQPSLA